MKKRRLWKILLTAALSLFCAVVLVVLGAIAYFRLSVLDYYQASEKAFEIPGLADDFVPQGLHYDEARGHFLATGYSSAGEASPIYMVSKESGELLKEVRMQNEDGSDFVGHASGLAVFGDWLYVAGGSDRCLYVFSYVSLLEAENGEHLRCVGKFFTQVSETDYVNVSFVSVEGDRLILGEFYDEPKYPTLETHKMTTSAGEYQQAVALEYRLSADATVGILPTPERAYSMTDCVQGICLSDGKMYLSTSYGASFSVLYEYEEATMTQEGTITLLGRELPLYAVDSASMTASYSMIPMSEEIAMVDGRLYMMGESASNKYLFGKLIGGKWCYATDLEKMK